MDEERFGRAVQHLRTRGLNLIAVLACAALPEPVAAPIRRQGIDLTRYQRLVLLGNSGRTLWRTLTAGRPSPAGFDSADPFDEFSIRAVRETVGDHLGDPAIRLLYPGETTVPLQRLGRLAGWHHDSPLGIGINRAYGLWFAYRAAFLIDAPLPLARERPTPAPCGSCRAHDCVSACPAGAVGLARAIDTDACITFALREHSPCRTRCLAREACPVAPQHRYEREQITYHYARAIAAIERCQR